MKYYLLCSNLFLTSKFSQLELTDSLSEADKVIVDLEHPDAFSLLEKYSCVCFCSHVKTELIEKAKALGAPVYARSVFFKKLESLLNSSLPKELPHYIFNKLA